MSEQSSRSILARLRDGVRGFWSGPFFSSDHNPWWRFGQAAVASGVTVNLETALGVSAFFCAVSTISQDIASLPLFLYKGSADGGKQRFEAHPLNRLLHDQPNPEMTSFQLRAALMVNALAGGNGYAEIQRDGAGRPTALWHLHPYRVSLFRQNGALMYRVSNVGGGDSILEPSDILHIKGPSPDGVLGFDVVHLGREALGLSIGAERFGATFFGNGSQLGGVLSTGPLSEPAQRNLQKALESRHQGVDRAHKWLLAPPGSTFTPIGVNPRDSQFNELRVHQIREVARFFRIPVAYLGDLERATYSNFEQMQLTYFTTGLRPWLVSIEQELDSKLIASSEKNIQHFEHVAEGFLRADVEKRGAFYSTMITNGVMTINEVRSRENLPPIEGGDVPRVPLNTEALTAPTPAAPPIAPVNPRDVLLLAAQRDVLIYAFDGVIKRETERARQAQSTPDKFRKWAIGFYDGHGDWMRSRIVPPLRAWAVCIGGDMTTLNEKVDAVITQWIARSKRDFEPVVTSTDPDAMAVALERVLRRWEAERAIEMTDALLAQGTASLGLPTPLQSPERHVMSVSLARKRQLLVEPPWPRTKPPATGNIKRLQAWINTGN